MADFLNGRSSAMQEVRKLVDLVSAQKISVLIQGENGTGKEFVAQTISQQRSGFAEPLLSVSCAAVPDVWVETDLFGHEKGAFPGACHTRIGKLELCQGGTLFLDEIADLEPRIQAKVARVLQEKRFERMGSTQSIPANVCLIAGTSRDLQRMVEEGTFRSDLYHHLTMICISLPPLRDRLEDLPLLADHFRKCANAEFGKQIEALSPEAMEMLLGYSWPGNVRELESVIKFALLHATGDILLSEFLPETIRSGDAARDLCPTDERHALREFVHLIQDRLRQPKNDLHAELIKLVESQLLLEVLRHTKGNQSRAARILGITRPTLRSKLASLDLSITRQVNGHG